MNNKLENIYARLSLDLLKINRIIEDKPKTITIPSIIFEDVMNEGMLSARAFEVPKTKPHIMENSDKLILFPTSLLVDSIVDTSDKSFWFASVNTKRLFVMKTIHVQFLEGHMQSKEYEPAGNP